MKIKQIIEQQRKTLSLEFFPPKTQDAEIRLFDAIRGLETLNPSFVSVTYGAGGGTRKTTRHVVERIMQETALTPMPHLTCIGQSEEELRSILHDYRELGIENILALRGDLPREAKKSLTKDSSCRAINLVQMAASFEAFSIGVAVYPEGHIEAPDLKSDLLYTKQKIEAGADFAITQMFFYNYLFYDFLERAEKSGIHIPIIPGIMVITDIEKIKKFAQNCGAILPPPLVRRMEGAASSVEVESIGIEFATKQCYDLWHNGIRFFHFYTLNRAAPVTEVLRNLSLDRSLGARAQMTIESGTPG